jgi:hypothetical protein
LRIVLEFDHIVTAVIAAYQLRLRPTTHSPDLLDGHPHARHAIQT